MHFFLGRHTNELSLPRQFYPDESFYFIVGMATAAWVCVTSVSRHNCVTVFVWV